MPADEKAANSLISKPIGWSIAIVCAIAFAPFLAGFLFIHPSYDDLWYYYMAGTRGALGSNLFWYQDFSGRFVSNFLLSTTTRLSKTVWLYRAACVSIFISLGWSLHRFLRISLGVPSAIGWALAGLMISAWLTIIPAPNAALYWFVGAVNYTLSAAVALYALSGIWNYSREDGAHWLWWSFWLILAIGMNELNMIILDSCVVFLLLKDVFARRSVTPGKWIWLASAAVASVAVVAAPGNWKRLNISAEGNPVAGHLWPALASGAYELLTDSYTLVMFSPVVFLLLILVVLRGRGTEQVTREEYKAIAAAGMSAIFFAVVVYALIVFYTYTQGIRTVARILNVIDLVMIIVAVVVVNAAVASGQNQPRARLQNQLPMFLLLIGFCTYLIRPESHVRTAYREWVSGQWARFDSEVSHRREHLERQKGLDVTVPATEARPWTLFVFDVSGNPEQRYNRYYAYYFGLKSIRTTVSAGH